MPRSCRERSDGDSHSDEDNLYHQRGYCSEDQAFNFNLSNSAKIRIATSCHLKVLCLIWWSSLFPKTSCSTIIWHLPDVPKFASVYGIQPFRPHNIIVYQSYLFLLKDRDNPKANARKYQGHDECNYLSR